MSMRRPCFLYLILCINIYIENAGGDMEYNGRSEPSNNKMDDNTELDTNQKGNNIKQNKKSVSYINVMQKVNVSDETNYDTFSTLTSQRKKQSDEPSMLHQNQEKLRDEADCFTSSNTSSVTVDCSWKSLATFNLSWVSPNTNLLYMQGNEITRLSSHSFTSLSNLTALDLSYNQIVCIEAGAFDGLQNLKILDLSFNRLNFNSLYVPETVFFSLLNLQELNLFQDVDNSDSPDKLIGPLINLVKLSLNSTDNSLYLGPQFKNLTKLSSLCVSGNANYITNKSFENVAPLKELYLQDFNNIKNISTYAFEPLKNLSTLHLIHCMLDLHSVLSTFRVFNNRSMSSIELHSVGWSLTQQDRHSYIKLTPTDTKHLTNIRLQSLVINDTNIIMIEPKAFNHTEIWDTSLQSFRFSRNPVAGYFEAFQRILNFKSLVHVSLTNVFRPCYPNNYPADSLRNVRSKRNIFKTDRTNVNASFISSNSRPWLSLSKFYGVTYSISPSIRTFIAQRFIVAQRLSENLFIQGAENVQIVDFSDNGFTHFKGVIQGFTSIRKIIFSGNDMGILSSSFFDSFPTLEELILSSCRFNQKFMAEHGGRVFEKLVHLKSLDLSSNSLHFLNKSTFSFNSKIQSLNLARNQFKEIPFDLTDTPELYELDLRYNALTSIDSHTIRELDTLALKPSGLKLHLTGNILSCGCRNLPFLQWQDLTRVDLDENGNYTCINQDGHLVFTSDYHDLEGLWRNCSGGFYLSLSVILVCVHLIGFLAAFLLMRHKTLIQSTLLQLLTGFKLHTLKNYNIGVFIGYADKDYHFSCTDLREYIENRLKLSTYIIERDLLLSSHQASGITDAINASWRIVLVCSKSFLQDDQWSLFTIRSALYSQNPANPSRIVVLVHEECVHQLPTDLLASVSEDNVIVVDQWRLHYEVREKLRTRLIGN